MRLFTVTIICPGNKTVHIVFTKRKFIVITIFNEQCNNTITHILFKRFVAVTLFKMNICKFQ